MINYTAEPNVVTEVTDIPDVDNVFHLALVDYVKSRLFLDKAGTEDDISKAAFYERMSLHHEKLWTNAVQKYGAERRDKIGGRRQMIGRDWK